MVWLVNNSNLRSNITITVVGCGGTGSLVSDSICRLLVNRPDAHLVLVDYDRVEEHNIARQNFHPAEVGMFKSQALAQRLSRVYGREVQYSMAPWSEELHNDIFLHPWVRGMAQLGRGAILGCVDNPLARAAIQKGFARNLRQDLWWIDAGNGQESGQVLIGNAFPEALRGAFLDGPEIVLALPLPTVQQPGLLTPTAEAPAPPDCGQAVAAGDQSPTINQAMATLMLEYVRRLLRGTLPWMASYLDLHAGALTSVPITPEAVARMTGLKVKELVATFPGPKPCHRCGEIHEAAVHSVVT